MKLFIIAVMVIVTVSCHRAIVPANNIRNTEIKNASGQTILVGRANISSMQLPNYKTWYDDSYNKYTVDAASATTLKPLLANKRVEVFLGSWCGDSRREVPRMIKILEQAGMDTTKLSIVFVDNSPEVYKQSPQHEEQGRNIHRVPSFILYDGNKELGRIVESPLVSLEKDLLSILQNQSYAGNYRGVDYWIKNNPSRNNLMADAELQKQVGIIKPLCKHYGEFNTYGYVLLAAKNNAEAINVFKLNTFIYPETAGVFDSLGEAYEKTGNKKDAITAYEKVLQLQPSDENAKKRIAALKGQL